jgi:hypothetical protein
MINTEPVSIRIGDQPADEDLLVEQELEELLDEVEAENEDVPLVRQASLWKRVQYLFGHYPKKSSMVYRFQRLAGIVKNDTVAALTINNQRVFFKQHPKWHEIFRYKLCGFKYETYV